MAGIGCSTFFSSSGWHCQAVQAGGAVATYISTPIVLPGGKPLDFYLIPRGEHLEFTDDGVTMFALSGLGYQLGDKRNWKGLENLAVRHGFTLTEAGAFEAMFLQSELPEWGGRIIKLFAAIAAWEDERFIEGDTDLSLAAEIEMLLRAKAPEKQLVRNATVTLGNNEISFDFLWGDTYVDAIRPVAQSVNARLRKAILINRSEEPLNLLFIIDNRGQEERAEAEISVLGDIASTIRLTDFEKHYSPALH